MAVRRAAVRAGASARLRYGDSVDAAGRRDRTPAWMYRCVARYVCVSGVGFLSEARLYDFRRTQRPSAGHFAVLAAEASALKENAMSAADAMLALRHPWRNFASVAPFAFAFLPSRCQLGFLNSFCRSKKRSINFVSNAPDRNSSSAKIF